MLKNINGLVAQPGRASPLQETFKKSFIKIEKGGGLGFETNFLKKFDQKYQIKLIEVRECFMASLDQSQKVDEIPDESIHP